MSATTIPRTLFVTGGMSGLGKALAAIYLGRGADVAIFDLAVNEEVIAELGRHKLRDTQKLVAYAASVTDMEALSEAVSEAVKVIGISELAINCAGIQRAAPFEELSGADFELVVQVNGKLRATIDMARGATKEDTEGAAFDDAKVQQAIAGKEVRKVIVVPDRIVNIVV